ncbi:MAG: hypothetical protein AAGD01_04005 [Acidobacteriota bacterium]
MAAIKVILLRRDLQVSVPATPPVKDYVGRLQIINEFFLIPGRISWFPARALSRTSVGAGAGREKGTGFEVMARMTMTAAKKFLSAVISPQ